MFSLNFMFFCSLIEELCTKEENYEEVVTLILDMSVVTSFNIDNLCMKFSNTFLNIN